MIFIQVAGLFTNFTWTKENLTVEEIDVVRHWSTEYTDVYVSLAGFTLFTVSFSYQNYPVAVIVQRALIPVHFFHNRLDDPCAIGKFHSRV